MESAASSFPELIRLRREAAGLSRAGLGELVGRSASAVRNWERGRSMPGEPEVLEALAATLGISDGELAEVLEPERLAFDPSHLGLLPEEPQGPPGEPELDLEHSQDVSRPEAEAPGEVVHGEPPRSGSGPPAQEPGAPAPSWAGSVSPIAGTETQPRPTVPQVRRPTGPPEGAGSGAASATPEPGALPLSYVEDPQQLAVYRHRAIVTTGVLVALLLVLRWAVGEFAEAIRSVLELFG
ncbi:MAG: helix-turn-helix domain-containing protein [Actinomycetota bacterium]|nr:helix-turn-helix domain-containing protein [Actinomycetota bacterium]